MTVVVAYIRTYVVVVVAVVVVIIVCCCRCVVVIVVTVVIVVVAAAAIVAVAAVVAVVLLLLPMSLLLSVCDQSVFGLRKSFLGRKFFAGFFFFEKLLCRHSCEGMLSGQIRKS
jgi:hypothetical protein